MQHNRLFTETRPVYLIETSARRSQYTIHVLSKQKNCIEKYMYPRGITLLQTKSHGTKWYLMPAEVPSLNFLYLAGMRFRPVWTYVYSVLHIQPKKYVTPHMYNLKKRLTFRVMMDLQITVGLENTTFLK